MAHCCSQRARWMLGLCLTLSSVGVHAEILDPPPPAPPAAETPPPTVPPEMLLPPTAPPLPEVPVEVPVEIDPALVPPPAQ